MKLLKLLVRRQINPDKQTKIYDQKSRTAKWLVCDRVLVKILIFDGKYKLSDQWSDEIYVVTEQPNENILVYQVKKEDGQNSEKNLHRNNLLYLGNKLLDIPETLDEQMNKPQHDKPMISSPQ